MDQPPTEKLLTEESPAKEIKHDPAQSTAPASSPPPSQHPPSSQAPYHPQGPGQTGPGTYEPPQGPRKYPFGAAARLPKDHPLSSYVSRKKRKILGLEMKYWAVLTILLLLILPTFSIFLLLDSFNDGHRDIWEREFQASIEDGGHYRFTLESYSYYDEIKVTFQVTATDYTSRFDVYIMDHDQYWNSYPEENDGKERAFAAQLAWENTTSVSETAILSMKNDQGCYLIIDNHDSSLRSLDAVPTGILEVDIHVDVLLSDSNLDYD